MPLALRADMSVMWRIMMPLWRGCAAQPTAWVVWMLSYTMPRQVVNQTADRTLGAIAPVHRPGMEGRRLLEGALGAIRLIFRNAPGDLDAARNQLRRNF